MSPTKRSGFVDQRPSGTVAGGARDPSLSLAVMPTLFVLKQRTAHAIGSRSLLGRLAANPGMLDDVRGPADRRRTELRLCAWQADPIAGLVIALYLLKEAAMRC